MDETRVKDELRSYVGRGEPPLGATASELIARGRKARGRRWLAMGAAATATVVAAAVVGVPLVTHGKESTAPASAVDRKADDPAEQRMNELILAQLPRNDELVFKEIKAFRWDQADPLPESRLAEATSWVATYEYDTGNDYLQDIRVTLGYFPPKQWPPVVDGCSYPTSDRGVPISYSWGRMARDLRVPAEAGSPMKPGYLVTVEAEEQGYNVMSPDGGTPGQGTGDGDGGAMTGQYTWDDQWRAATDPDLVFDPPATWPENVVSPVPLTAEQRAMLEANGVEPGGC